MGYAGVFILSINVLFVGNSNTLIKLIASCFGYAMMPVGNPKVLNMSGWLDYEVFCLCVPGGGGGLDAPSPSTMWYIKISIVTSLSLKKKKMINLN